MVVVNIFIFVLIESIMRQNEKSQELIQIKSRYDAQQERMTQLLDNHEHIRQISHDFKQQADILYRLCHEKKYDELLSSLSKLSHNHSTLWPIQTGNMMLDTLLSSKNENAVRQGINFNLELDVQPELEYVNMDVCILLGNAIDNAIEACVRSCPGKKYIEMDLTANLSSFMFYLKNDIGEPPQIDGEQIKTQKSDKLRHGVGLKSMKQIVKKLGGNMSFEYDNDKFELWIHIAVK